MKATKVVALVTAAFVISIAGGVAGALFLTRNSSPLPEIPAKSTVRVPEADTLEIETITTNNIPTTARAGSQSHAIFTSYSSGKAEGYLTYEAAPEYPASFIVSKDSKGKWKVETYKVYGNPKL